VVNIVDYDEPEYLVSRVPDDNLAFDVDDVDHLYSFAFKVRHNNCK